MRLVALALLVAAPVLAQPVTPEAACSYTDCAIRVEPGFFLGPEIVRGAPGQEVSVRRVGYFVGGLEDAVSTSPLALEHVASARRARVGSLAAFAAALGLTFYGVTRAYSDDSISRAEFDVFYYSGLALSVAGGVFELKSQREQSRAVWEYNRTLAGE